MKHFNTIVFFLTCIFVINCTSLSAQYRIIGNVHNEVANLSEQGIQEGSIITLNFMNIERIDTTYVHNNQFIFTGKIPYPSLATIEYEYGGHVLFLDNAEYEYNLTLIKENGNSFHYDGELKTKSEFYTTWLDFFKIDSTLCTQKEQYATQLKNSKNRDSVLIFQNEIRKIDLKIVNHYWEFTDKCPNKYLVAYIAPSAPDFSYKKYEKIYNNLPSSVKESYYGKYFLEKLNSSKSEDSEDSNKSIINSQMPDINAGDSTGNKIIIDKEFYKKHSFTIIDFWASWCGPCRKSNVNLKTIHKELTNKDITIVGFSLDKNAYQWKNALKKDDMNWLHISDLMGDNSPLVNLFKISSIPANLIIDHSGKIIGRNIPVNEIISFIEKHANNPTSTLSVGAH